MWDKAILHADWVITRKPGLDPIGTLTAAPGTWPLFETGRVELIWFYSNSSDMYELATDKNSLTRDEFPVFGPSPSLINLYEPGDKRLEQYFVPLKLVTDPARKGYLRTAKHKAEKRVFGRGFRVSEAYMNRAEANIELVRDAKPAGTIQQALLDLNTLRASRFTQASFQPVTITDPNQLLNFCKDERRREFCFETSRWFDLRRYGMPAITHNYINDAGATVTYTLKANDPAYVLPIPPIVLQHDGTIRQNTLAPERAAQ